MNLFSALGVAFIVLKLCGVIAWSWWWVTAPLWGGFLFCFLCTIIYGWATKTLDKKYPLWRYEKYLKK